MQVIHANRFNQRVDLPEFLQFILEKITANGADFADGFLVAVALWATWHKCCFLLQHGASHSEAATVKESAKRQVPARCAAVAQGAEKHQPLPRRQLRASAHLAAGLCRV
jgi:hypothetical protein